MRNFKKKAHILTICSVAIVMLISVCTSLFIMPLQNAAAASDENTVWRKTLANAIPQCYSSTYMKDSIDGPNYYGTDSVFKKKGSFINPNGNKMGCRQVFKEANKFFGKNPTLIDLGYTMTTSADASEARNCLWLEYYMSVNGVDDNSPRKTNQICFHIQDGTIMEDPEVQSGGDAGDLSLSWSGNGWINIYNSQNPDLELTANYYSQSWEKLVSNLKSAANRLPSDYGASVEQDSSSTDVYQKYIISNGNYTAASKKALDYYTGKDSVADFKFDDEDLRYFWDQAYAKMKADEAIAEAGTCFGTEEAARNHNSERYPYVYYNPSAPANAQWCPVRVSDNSHSYPVVASNRTSLTVSNPETILGLMTKDAWHNAADQCIAAAIVRKTELNDTYISLLPRTEENQARLDYLSESLRQVRKMLDNDGSGTYTKTGSGANTVVTCKALPTVDGGTDVFEPDDGSGQNPGTTPPSDEGDQPGMFDGCMNNSGALGWILCPVIRIVSTTVDGIYSDIEDNYLVVKSETVTHDATRSTWNIFQNLANIAFAIFFLFVILSQVTGFGLDNYGVKKALPRLIVTVILVNLSFFICQIAVDVSNIVGEQLNMTLSGINVGDTDGFVLNIGTFAGNTISSLLSFGTATLVGGYAIATNIELLVLPALLFVLTAFISVVFFYILLGARQAIIIILIVISPLAMICYALPNTKTLFDKWKKIFVALLIVYPICGALMGGGNLASRLLLISAGQNVPFMYALVAMLLSVIPFFFVPSLVRNSMASLGTLGAKIAMAGRRISSGSTRAIRGTDAYRDAQNRLTERNALRRASRLESGRGVRNWASRRLRGAGFTGASDRIDDSLERSRNRLIAKQRKLAMDDVNAGVHLDALTGEARDNAVATAQYKHDMGLVDEAENSYVTNSDFNHNDISTLGNAFDDVMRDLTLDENNVLLQARARALSRMLMNKGTNGQDRLLQSLKNRTYAAGDSRGTKDVAGKSVMGYLANDDKMMGQLKEGNYGDWKFVNQYASNGALDARSRYETMGADSLSSTSIAKAGDDWYKNFLRHAGAVLDGNGHVEYTTNANGSRVVKFDQAKSLFAGTNRENEIFKIAHEAQAALNDERIRSVTKGEVQDWLRGIIDISNETALNTNHLDWII